jgi:DNA repair protein RadD
MNRELWPHQISGLEALRQSVAQGIRRIVLCAPTGSGKTLLSAAIVEGAQRKGNRLAFVVSNISLIDQSIEAFYEEGIRDIGVLQSNHHMQDWSKPVQICSVQTLKSRGAFPEAQIVIIDECHVLHEHHKKWLMHPDWQNVPFIGLSATPGTRGLGKYFQTLLTISTTQELIEKGFLSPFKVFATGHPDLSGVKIVAGDYQEDQLSDAMQKGELTADIVRTWQDKWGKDRTLCYAVDCAHAQSIQERFEQAGVKCGYQDARTSSDERREIKRKFHNGEYSVVTNVGTLTTGTDWDCRCLILARPTRSKMLFQQIIGRALRTKNDKQFALILDHSSTTANLGFVTDIHWDSLDDGKPQKKSVAEKKEPLPKECSECAYLKPPRTKVCPNCGHESKIQSDIIEQDGELVEWIPGKRAKEKRRKLDEFTEQERATFLSELKAYGIQHDYKPGWSATKYKEKFKEWPPRSIANVAPARWASATTSLWIRSRNIAFHKARAKQNAQVDDAQ